MLRPGFVRSAAAFLLATLMVATPERAPSQTFAPNSAAWFCHDGVTLLHAGQANTEKSTPIDWNVDMLVRADRDFARCYQLSDGPGRDLYVSEIGFGEADLQLAEYYHALSLFLRIVAPGTAASKFTTLHGTALGWVRRSVRSFETFSHSVNDNPSIADPDAYLQASQVAQNDLGVALRVKKIIIDTSFEMLPHNNTELLALIDADRMPAYRSPMTWGLTREEACPTASTPVTITNPPTPAPDAPAVSALTEIEVHVAADGTLRSAHILSSSGSDEADAKALTTAYGLHYKPATKRCDPVEATGTIEL